MKCDFCGHEVASGTVECPYCHYQFKIDAQVLSPEERDTFEGVTIDESAGTEENKSAREALYMTAVLMLIMKTAAGAAEYQGTYLWLRQRHSDYFSDFVRHCGSYLLFAADVYCLCCCRRNSFVYYASFMGF